MPIFEYECRQCQHEFELLVPNSDKDRVQCPECGAGEAKRKLSVFSSPKSSGVVERTSKGAMPSGCAGCAHAASCGMGF